MNKTTTSILVGAALVAGAVAFSGDVNSQTTIEAVDSSTIKVTEPVNVDIRDLKAQVDALQGEKAITRTYCDNYIAELNTKIDAKKALILQAKNVGVE